MVSLTYAKRVKVLFWYPMAAILDCFLPPITKNNIQLDYRDKIQLKSGVFNVLTYTGPSPGPLPSPAVGLTGEYGREV